MLRTVSFLFTFFITSLLIGQNSAQWRGENRDGIYNESGLLTEWPADGPKLLWHYDNLGPGHASAAIAVGKVFVSGVEGENGFVLALSMAGNEIWKTTYGKEWVENFDGIRSTPNINDGRVYIMSGHGLVTCMDAESGEIIWKVDFIEEYGARNIRWGMTENLLIFDNQIICTPGGIDANMVSLDKNTGNLLWKTKGTGEKTAYCSPQFAIHNGIRMVMTHSESKIYAVSADNGDFLWSYDWPNKYAVQPNTPLYIDGKIFCTSGYGQGSALLELAVDGKSVKLVWENKLLDNQMGGFVLLDGNIYSCGQNSRKWMAVDFETGKELYSFKDIKVGNIISAEGLLYWYGQDGNVALVEPGIDSFNVKGKFKVPYGSEQHWAHLVISNKWLFVRHGTSLMAYDIAK